jgi:hypothetical protein
MIPPLSLTDAQIKMLMTVAAQVAPERRSQFLQRVAAMLRIRGYGHVTDSDVQDVVWQRAVWCIRPPMWRDLPAMLLPPAMCIGPMSAVLF